MGDSRSNPLCQAHADWDCMLSCVGCVISIYTVIPSHPPDHIRAPSSTFAPQHKVLHCIRVKSWGNIIQLEIDCLSAVVALYFTGLITDQQSKYSLFLCFKLLPPVRKSAVTAVIETLGVWPLKRYCQLNTIHLLSLTLCHLLNSHL